MGCQDLSWDLAGAAVEPSLDAEALAAASYDAHAPDEAARLRHAAARYAELLRRELASASSRPRLGGVGVDARM
ncbi:hypothetical protein MXAN_0420 [Myxococcus xanthus DK 1622]|uniref:Uncharacterized protein n=1 Tax=Myxococcus xanthus (strain DK1622) TaxID=246197 RepID=Q1DF82_MYXXD|nr:MULTISPECIES: hypothetical protein [Myxococcus]ABF90068.1 hypothetical protein MXAN_0420 [Myxococcus xanthus DK 1622]NOJ53034.1 hypothetical protein [Myxococcus xanthus]QPM80129.1 hypothetical protein I5Q59_02175 [Myxococcus xanthus]QVW69193.1 hypothetical protein JTM82_06465 [Myxococcus xanthus DZ2]QZZ47969.1 hypothetical protein MyxoNM_02090 [Myxococcus xanthus]